MPPTRCGGGWAWTKSSVSVGFSEKERLLTQVMVTNRLVSPASEHAMPDWAETDRAGRHPGRGSVRAQQRRAVPADGPACIRCGRGSNGNWPSGRRNLFNLDGTVFLYDLTSTYFEGQCPKNPQAKEATPGTDGTTASRWSWAWWWTGTGSPRPTRSSTATEPIATTVEEMLGCSFQDGQGRRRHGGHGPGHVEQGEPDRRQGLRAALRGGGQA